MIAQINVFDVEHGACASVLTPNGQLILLDCGHNTTRNWRPSSWLNSQGWRPELLIISNLDEDHVSDLPNIDRVCAPRRFYTNSTISADYVIYKKSEGGGIGPGIAKAVAYMRRNTVSNPPIEYGLEIRTFEHPQGLFDDFNNLSVVTFLFYAGHGIVFPGDVEQKAWHVFLANGEFRQCLSRINLFVASHHGRESGLEPTVFDHCHPEIIIVSDKSIQHQTQQTSRQYGAYASGIMFGGTRRDVLTTRNDGTISISIQSNGQGRINTDG